MNPPVAGLPDSEGSDINHGGPIPSLIVSASQDLRICCLIYLSDGATCLQSWNRISDYHNAFQGLEFAAFQNTAPLSPDVGDAVWVWLHSQIYLSQQQCAVNGLLLHPLVFNQGLCHRQLSSLRCDLFTYFSAIRRAISLHILSAETSSEWYDVVFSQDNRLFSYLKLFLFFCFCQ